MADFSASSGGFLGGSSFSASSIGDFLIGGLGGLFGGGSPVDIGLAINRLVTEENPGTIAGQLGVGDCSPGTFYKQGGSTVRAKRLVLTENPETGNINYFKNAGQPILFADDLRALDRVQRVARRARRPRRSGKRR